MDVDVLVVVVFDVVAVAADGFVLSPSCYHRRPTGSPRRLLPMFPPQPYPPTYYLSPSPYSPIYCPSTTPLPDR